MTDDLRRAADIRQAKLEILKVLLHEIKMQRRIMAWLIDKNGGTSQPY